MSGHYVSSVKCKNCKVINPTKVERGTEVEDFLEEDNTKCWSCDCKLAKEKKGDKK